MMSRLSRQLQVLRSSGEKAMGLFVTSGFPSLADTPAILRAMDDGGADFIELGMPFSDPLAEGLPIQRSSARALAGGITMSDAFNTVAEFRKHSDTPLLLMGYINPVLQYGMQKFCRAARQSGVDGLIIPDLPPQEASTLSRHCQNEGLDIIFLIAPNSHDERIRAIDRLTTGFVYAVSITGLTGAGLHGRMKTIELYLQRVRKLVTRNPLLVGFGIRTHEDAVQLCQHTDGFIAGSSLVNLIEQIWDHESLTQNQRLDRIKRFAQTLKYGKIPDDPL